MFCKKCNMEIDNDAVFCKYCGLNNKDEYESIVNDNDSDSVSVIFDLKSRKSINKKTIILIASIGIISIFAILYVALVINTPSNRFSRFISQGDINSATFVFNENIKGNTDKESVLKEDTTYSINILKTDYIDKKITYDEVVTLLDSYSKISMVYEETMSIRTFIEQLNSSRNSFSKAEEFEKINDIVNAIIHYNDVLDIDNNFPIAKEKVKTLKDTYKNTILLSVDKLAKKQEYMNAIDELEKALLVLHNDSEFMTKKDVFIEKQIEQETKDFEEYAKSETERINNIRDNQKISVTNAYSEEGYINNEAFITVKNNTDQVVKGYVVGILMFDNNGYPVNNTYEIFDGYGNLRKGKADTPNIQAGDTYGSLNYWDIEGNAYKIKACVISAEFYDDSSWYNEYFDYWFQAEKDKY